MFTHIIREVYEPDFTFYFDTDCFSENSGDYNNTLFLLTNYHGRLEGLNVEEYNNIVKAFTEIIDCFDFAENGGKCYGNARYTFKMAMQENGLTYSSTKCHKLRELCKTADVDDLNDIANYLTIKTGKTWETSSARGYCQGDFVNILYCKDVYKQPEIEGELFLGAGKEFSITEIDENGNENELTTVYGYFVADCQAKRDADYKTIVCEMEGLKPEETKLEMINYSSIKTYLKTDYNYTEI